MPCMIVCILSSSAADMFCSSSWWASSCCASRTSSLPSNLVRRCCILASSLSSNVCMIFKTSREIDFSISSSVWCAGNRQWVQPGPRASSVCGIRYVNAVCEALHNHQSTAASLHTSPSSYRWRGATACAYWYFFALTWGSLHDLALKSNNDRWHFIRPTYMDCDVRERSEWHTRHPCSSSNCYLGISIGNPCVIINCNQALLN